MPDPTERTQTWRAQKKKAGFQPLTIWVKAEVKHRAQDLCFQRRIELGEIFTEGVKVLEPASARRPTRADEERMREIAREIANECIIIGARRLGLDTSLLDDISEPPVSHPADAPSAEKRKVMAYISELHTQGLSHQKIADRLQQEGIPTFEGHEKWHRNTVGKIIKRIKANPGLLANVDPIPDAPETSL
jgi:hypothetical protein